MINIESLLRDNIKKLEPYSTARDEYKGNAGIFLDANENSFGSIPNGNLNRYPDPHMQILKLKLSKIKNTNIQNIFIGNGSDEAIDLLLRAFCEPGKDSIIILPPTYGMYKIAAEINDVKIIEIPLTNDFQIATTKVLGSIEDSLKVIFICSPNNPSGNLMNKDSIRTILNTFNGIVVIDEAYIDFAGTESWISELANYNNLVVLQTFSKAWGLANIRVGTAFANQYIISVLDKIKYPYNVNGVSQKIIIDSLDYVAQKEQIVKSVLYEKDKLITALSSLDIIDRVFLSDANFILAKVKQANKVYVYLLEHKIIVRNRSNMIHCDNCLRFTVGTGEENKKLIEILSKYGD